MENKEFYTAEELAEKLRLNIMTIYRYIKAGKIAARKIGRDFRIEDKDYFQFLHSAKIKEHNDNLLNAKNKITNKDTAINILKKNVTELFDKSVILEMPLNFRASEPNSRKWFGEKRQEAHKLGIEDNDFIEMRNYLEAQAAKEWLANPRILKKDKDLYLKVKKLKSKL